MWCCASSSMAGVRAMNRPSSVCRSTVHGDDDDVSEANGEEESDTKCSSCVPSRRIMAVHKLANNVGETGEGGVVVVEVRGHVDLDPLPPCTVQCAQEGACKWQTWS